jgi:hypothetical protein
MLSLQERALSCTAVEAFKTAQALVYLENLEYIPSQLPVRNAACGRHCCQVGWQACTAAVVATPICSAPSPPPSPRRPLQWPSCTAEAATLAAAKGQP